MNSQTKNLLSISYLGPVRYYAWILTSRQTLIEQHENYSKQSYRNRCRIAAANGPLSLAIPVVHHHGNKTKITDIKIDYSTSWQNIHWRSIISAYRSSPFFEFYEHELAGFYTSREKYLFDFDRKLLDLMLGFLQIEKPCHLTSSYVNSDSDAIMDLRDMIHPKKSKNKDDGQFRAVPYDQVFHDRFDFIPDLSIIDLLFNKGPESRKILKECMNNKW